MSLTHHFEYMGGFVFSTFAGVFAFLAQVTLSPDVGWFEIISQSGMIAAVALLAWRVPELLKHQRETQQSFLNALEKRDQAHEKQQTEWREMIERRGWCPVRDGGKDSE